MPKMCVCVCVLDASVSVTEQMQNYLTFTISSLLNYATIFLKDMNAAVVNCPPVK